MPGAMRLFRATVMHTPRDPFREPGALEAFADGAIAVIDGRIVAVGEYRHVRRGRPGWETVDLRPGVLLPGFVDTHVHLPQIRVIGGMGLRLLDWLRERALPEEARLADARYAAGVARAFLRGLARAGTTTALVFGAHFPAAQEVFFKEAHASGLRITSGLVLADRNLLPELHQPPEQALRESAALIDRWHGRGRLRYAVTPRFAAGASQGMLEAAGALVRRSPDLLVQTHMNETLDEMATVHRLFPEASDYLDVYERHGLAGPRSVFAHNVHSTDGELERLAGAGAAVAHCPTSNAFLGSGLFPLRRHVESGVRVALGSDVGAGTGLCLLKEGLAAYQAQMLRADGYPLTPVHLLYLATAAGARALGLEDEAGDLSPGKSADFVLLRPPAGSVLAEVLSATRSPEEALGALFTLAGEESIAAVYVAGAPAGGRERIGAASSTSRRRSPQ